MDKIKQTVSKLIQKYKTNDPYEIADLKNIIIIREHLGKTLGYHNTYKRISFIHINHELSPTWQRFVCAHELGHNLLHPKVNTPFLKANTLFSVNRIESEANRLAIELLMPDNVIYTSEYTGLSLEQIAAICGIPHEVVQLKFRNL